MLDKEASTKKSIWSGCGSGVNDYDVTWYFHHWFRWWTLGGRTNLQPLPKVPHKQASHLKRSKLTFLTIQRLIYLNNPRTNVYSWDASHFANYYSK